MIYVTQIPTKGKNQQISKYILNSLFYSNPREQPDNPGRKAALNYWNYVEGINILWR